eukprot:TRINITY_DN9598_c1_g1_i1.p2 TRINITY_DN9598_c1_g1~~TRINITY_DN9598_c1_g1_i1.p2  ORF type:complete len:100 (+),score=5.51 TRINITY_DN9598_c1_g1_i1:156-455(+)
MQKDEHKKEAKKERLLHTSANNLLQVFTLGKKVIKTRQFRVFRSSPLFFDFESSFFRVMMRGTHIFSMALRFSCRRSLKMAKKSGFLDPRLKKSITDAS